MHKMYKIVFLYFFIALFLLLVTGMIMGVLGYVSTEPEDTKNSLIGADATSVLSKQEHKDSQIIKNLC